MSYYSSNENKIRRKKVSSSNSNKNLVKNNIKEANYNNKNLSRNKKIKNESSTRNDTYNLEREIYYTKKSRKRKKRNKFIKRALTLMLVLTFIGTIFASAVVAISLKGAPKVTKELVYNNYISQNIVDIDEIPKDLKDAIIATEDKRFYKHKGVDIRSLARSLVNNILLDSTQGGSTIDMQVSKNLLTSEDKNMKRKITDMYNAIQMNKIMTKDEILEAYLNNIYFGKGSYGVSDAAQTYFGKDVRDLNLAQCAMIAGITNNPGKYMQHDEAKRRQKVVLNHMYEQGYIEHSEYIEAINDPTPFKSEIA